MTVDTLGPQLQQKLHSGNYEVSEDVERTIFWNDGIGNLLVIDYKKCGNF
jgi:hypothetical protein